MERDFSIRYEWLESGTGLAVDAATAMLVTITVGNNVLTRVHDLRSHGVRDTIRVSGFRLATWFLENWWRIRYEIFGQGADWSFAHAVNAAGGGYIWPNVELSGDWDVVRCVVSETIHDNAQPVRFLTHGTFEIDANVFERTIDTFFSAVSDRLYEHSDNPDVSLYYDAFSATWDDLQKERTSQESARWRHTEAMLGYDIDEAPDDEVQDVIDSFGRYGERAVAELADEFKTETLAVIASLQKLVDTSVVSMNMAHVDSVRMEMAPNGVPSALQPAWQAAEQHAERVRKQLGITRGPVSNDVLADFLEMDAAFISGDDRRMEAPCSAGMIREHESSAVKPVIHHTWITSRRFAIARIMADRFLAPSEDRILPVTETKTWRQKFQRAFAQSLLCPAEELLEHIGRRVPDDAAIEKAAGYFEVSPLLVQRTLMNKGILRLS